MADMAACGTGHKTAVATRHCHTVLVASVRTSHVCSDCGTHHPKWLGQCSGCGAYGTLTEEVLSSGLPTEAHPGSPRPASSDARPPVAIADVVTAAEAACATGIAEFDRTLSGGLVPGSVTLLGGEPGIGKSTLALQIAGTWPGTVLYVSAEESAQQVRRRAERLGVVRDGLFLLAETGLGDIDAAVSQIGPSLMVIDSVQTVADPAVSSAPGSVSQVRAVAQHLTHIAKRHDLPTMLIGHVTKDGDLAGPRALEHLVDTVLTFEGDRHHALRMVRAVKHRYGSTNELSVFEMTGDGLRGVADPSALFLADRRPGTPGSAVVPPLEGRRPLVLEVQALTTAAPDNVPARRTTQHIDHNRLSLLLAVMERHAGLDSDGAEKHHPRLGPVRSRSFEQGVIGLQRLHRPKHVDPEVLLKLLGLQPPERLELDASWAVHQAVQSVRESREVARVRHRVEDQALVVGMLPAFALHTRPGNPNDAHALAQQLLAERGANAAAVPHNRHRPHDCPD